MILEIAGANTQNKGAELMLATLHKHFCVPESDVTFAVTPWFGSITDRLRYNLATKLNPIKKFGRSQIALKLLSDSFLKSHGLVQDQDLDGVLDISGFAFGDQHPAKRTLEFAEQVHAWKSLGKPIALLPQAFGPFENSEIRAAFAKVYQDVDLIYARDKVSYQHLQDSFGESSKLRLSPDITIGLQSEIAATDKSEEVFIVPNARMLDKSDKSQAEKYVPLLATCIQRVMDLDHKAVFLLHDTKEDKLLLPKVHALLGTEIEAIEISDPVQLKKKIGTAKLVIGSRFHALVSALSSSVPVLATGWSHKYEMLLEDFGCPDAILSLDDSEARIQELVTSNLDADVQKTTIGTLNDRGSTLREQIHTMWNEVDNLVNWKSA